MLNLPSSRSIICYLIFFTLYLNAQPCSCTKNKQQKKPPQLCSTCNGFGETHTDEKEMHKTICKDCGGIGFVVGHCDCTIRYVIGELSEEQGRKVVTRLTSYLERYNKTQYSKYRMYCEREIKQAACSIFALQEHAKWALPVISKTIKKMAKESTKKPFGYYGIDPYLEMAIFRIWLAAKQASVPYLIDLAHDDLCRSYAINLLAELDADISEAVPHVSQYRYDKRESVQKALQRFYKNIK